MNLTYMKIRNIIADVMLEEVTGKDNDEQVKILEYTTKIYKALENKLNVNLKVDNNSLLHTGDIPECCIHCDNYKEGQVSVCNCTLPCIELFKNIIGDNS